VYAGWVVPLDYDPMLSKLVAFAETREAAIDRMLRALEEYVVGGIKTNISLLRRILMDEDFRAARIDTGYLERLLAEALPIEEQMVPKDVIAVAAALFVSASAKDGGVASSTAVEGRWSVAARREGLRL
jgi:acetyl-CoA carboxylase, biotin carboxylase subunit